MAINRFSVVMKVKYKRRDLSSHCTLVINCKKEVRLQGTSFYTLRQCVMRSCIDFTRSPVIIKKYIKIKTYIHVPYFNNQFVDNLCHVVCKNSFMLIHSKHSLWIHFQSPIVIRSKKSFPFSHEASETFKR